MLTLAITPEEDLNFRRHTAPFLACLLGCSTDEAWIKPVTFQTFNDKKTDGAPRPALARVIHGSLEDHAAQLLDLNHQGAGIFVTVNGTDLKGRKKENIVSLRAHWADLDTKDATVELDRNALPLAPSMEVKTPGGHHLYWLPSDPMPCPAEDRRAEHEAEVKGIAEALAPFGGDLKACDVARVLRVPGFHHNKAEPRLVELVHASGDRYAREQLTAAFPPRKAESRPGQAREARQTLQGIPLERARVLERAAAYVDRLEGSVAGKGGNAGGGDKTFKDILKVMDGFDLSEEEAFSLAWERYNPKCLPPWSEEELRKKVQDAAPYCRDRGHLLKEPVEAPRSPNASTSTVTQGAPPSDRPRVPGFAWEARGLYRLEESKRKDDNGDALEPVRVWIAPPFTLPGLVRTDASHAWSLLVAWSDLDGVQHEEAVPFELLTGEGTELARALGQGGLILPPDQPLRRHLLRYLTSAARLVKTRVRTVETLGWIEGAFVLPTGEVIGQSQERYRFSGALPGLSGRACKGTLQGWQGGVARYAVGNPHLAFALACAFAGPILELVRPDGGGGFNLMGASSRGKSTCLECAASVWGRPDPLPTWRATSNGLEGVAAARNDGFLVLDELSQVEPREAGQVAYMLANGSAKARATKDGLARALRQWRLVFLSTGEVGLEDKLSEDGKQPRAGQEVRVPDIPCPPEGMFQTAHDLPSLGDLARHLKAEARSHYGHAIREFLTRLTSVWDRREELQAQLKSMEATLLHTVLSRDVDAQVERVAGRFSVVGVAGELAIGMGILPWPTGEASRAAVTCFQAWLDRRGYTDSSEAVRGVRAVLAFLDAHGSSRFDTWGDKDVRINNRAGTRKPADAPADGWDFFITPAAWTGEVTKGFQNREVSRACLSKGLLEADGKGKASKKMRIPFHGEVRVYVVRATAVAAYREREAE